MTTNLQVEEVAVTLFALDWPTSVWGETGLEPTYRRKAQAVWERIHAQRAGEGEADKRAKRDEGLADVKARNPSNLVAYSWGFGDGWDARAGEPPTPDEVERLREALTTAEHELAAAAGVMRADGSIQNAQIAYDAARFCRAALDAAHQPNRKDRDDRTD